MPLTVLLHGDSARPSNVATFGGSPSRNMVNTTEKNLPNDWSVKEGAQKNVKWSANIGVTGGRYLPPAVVGGQVYVATNNSAQADPKVKGQRAVLMCLRESDGKFLWQIAHDLPETLVGAGGREEGLLSTPAIEGDRLYYVTPGAEVVCADTSGKVIWTLDTMKELKVFPDAAAFCAPLVAGDLVFAVTGNGKDFGAPEQPAPQPKAPSFIAVNKTTGKLVWSDNSPGDKIMEGTWSSPVYGEVNGKGQVIFAGGDGWLYAFEPKDGKLRWKFDCNPKGTTFRIDSRGTRNYLMAPVVVGNRLYTGVGQQPENGTGVGHLWCVDITKAGDLSEELEKGKANPNSGVVWHYGGAAPQGSKRNYVFGRTVSTCAVADGLVYAAELDGFLHCVDAQTGHKVWDHDLKASVWGSPYVVDGKVYLANDDGDMYIFAHGKEKKQLAKIEMEQSIKSPAVAVNGVLYVQTDRQLFAIGGK